MWWWLVRVFQSPKSQQTQINHQSTKVVERGGERERGVPIEREIDQIRIKMMTLKLTCKKYIHV